MNIINYITKTFKFNFNKTKELSKNNKNQSILGDKNSYINKINMDSNSTNITNNLIDSPKNHTDTILTRITLRESDDLYFYINQPAPTYLYFDLNLKFKDYDSLKEIFSNNNQKRKIFNKIDQYQAEVLEPKAKKMIKNKKNNIKSITKKLDQELVEYSKKLILQEIKNFSTLNSIQLIIESSNKNSIDNLLEIPQQQIEDQQSNNNDQKSNNNDQQSNKQLINTKNLNQNKIYNISMNYGDFKVNVQHKHEKIFNEIYENTNAQSRLITSINNKHQFLKKKLNELRKTQSEENAYKQVDDSIDNFVQQKVNSEIYLCLIDQKQQELKKNKQFEKISKMFLTELKYKNQVN